jgi:hypothetical protein
MSVHTHTLNADYFCWILPLTVDYVPHNNLDMKRRISTISDLIAVVSLSHTLFLFSFTYKTWSSVTISVRVRSYPRYFSKKMAFKKMDVPTSKAFSSGEACSGKEMSKALASVNNSVPNDFGFLSILPR